ncbi:MAG TPA: PP0621 family protein [Burkholderiaceae bacterium]
MKLLLVLLAVLALLWLLRGSMHRRMPPSGGKAASPPAPQPMLRCAFCGTHLPRDEALPGRGGVFCDGAHRAAFEKTHPDS